MDKDKSGSTDPIQALVDCGVPIRTLIGYHLCCIDWLAARVNEKFRLCYFDDTGNLAMEDVSAAVLLLRGPQLGWHPIEDEPSEAGWPFLFEEAIHHFRNGVHWYASAISDTDGMLPLGFPKSVLESDRRRTDARIKRAMSRLQREQSAKRKAAAREVRAGHAVIMSQAIERMHLEAARNGSPIAASTAKRRARAWIRQWEQDIVTSMKRINERLEGAQNGN